MNKNTDTPIKVKTTRQCQFEVVNFIMLENVNRQVRKFDILSPCSFHTFSVKLETLNWHSLVWTFKFGGESSSCIPQNSTWIQVICDCERIKPTSRHCILEGVSLPTYLLKLYLKIYTSRAFRGFLYQRHLYSFLHTNAHRTVDHKFTPTLLDGAIQYF